MTTRSLLLTSLLFACTAPRTPPPVVAAHPALTEDAPLVASHSDASAPAADAAVDVCEGLLTEHRAAMASVRSGLGGEEINSYGRCLATPEGAWAVVLSRATYHEASDENDMAAIDAQREVVHLGRDRRVARIAQPIRWTSYSTPRLDHVALSDYDHDGSPELIVSESVDVNEGASSQRGEVFTARDGAVIPYAQAAGLEPIEARDVDGDGRLDLYTNVPYRGEGDDSPSGFTYEMNGPVLLAHSLAGGAFSRDDATAKSFARGACGERVATVFPRGFTGEGAGAAVVCARIWGVPAAAVVRAIRARCATVEQSSDGSTTRTRCGDVRVLTRWAQMAPPLTLP